jgi:glutamyl-Q tRNA(Asp) synthetase
MSGGGKFKARTMEPVHDTGAPGTPRYRGRFAPSPTGPLHLGSLTAALGSWLMARHAGGEWIVRVEDLDPPREVAGAAQRQLATLAAFGLESDAPVLWQSTRGDAYRAALERLVAQGDAFPCLCSRADLADSGGIHRACVARPSGRTRAWRLRVPDAVVGFVDRVRGPFAQHLARDVGDVVLRRADGPWAYQLAVVVDDAAQGITEVVRGADLLDSTPRQRYLQQRLGLPAPAYAHLPLLLDAAGAKLGKSQGAVAVHDADPLPALRAAYALLGQPAAALPAHGPVSVALECARRNFDPALVPATDTVLRGTD